MDELSTTDYETRPMSDSLLINYHYSPFTVHTHTPGNLRIGLGLQRWCAWGIMDRVGAHEDGFVKVFMFVPFFSSFLMDS